MSPRATSGWLASLAVTSKHAIGTWQQLIAGQLFFTCCFFTRCFFAGCFFTGC